MLVIGDLFESEADLNDPHLWQVSSWNQSTQTLSRNKILNLAKFIVPGHGPMFEVPSDNQSVTNNSI